MVRALIYAELKIKFIIHLNAPITVLEGKDLEGGNNCHSYCLIQVEGYQTRTPMIEKTNKPCWYEEMSFEIFDDDSIIALSVWDENHSSEKRIGQLYFPLQNLQIEEDNPVNFKNQFVLSSQWYKLEAPPKNNISGDVLIKIKITNKISIIILEARNLPCRDNGTTAEPFFKVKMN